ncbi:MAG: arylsulfatase A-like enzyme [Gammaproteobacteria bacterium]|jgi:arylsulfatase A-like enzyme
MTITWTEGKLRSVGFTSVVIGLGALLGGCGDEQQPAEQAATVPERYGKRVPVILVVMDALNSAHITHLGYERDTTPNIDAFAKDGLSFRAAFSPAPYTIAGISSLMTGRLPDSTGVTEKRHRLRDDETPLGQVLSTKGYRTRALVSNLNGGAQFGVMQGFDQATMLYAEGEPNYETRSGEMVHVPQGKAHIPLMREFLDEVQQDGPDTRFFFYSHMLEPHSPYIADEPFRTKYIDPAYDGIFKSGDTEDLLDTVHGRVVPSAEDIEAVRALYDGHLAFADDIFGNMMADLKARGLYEDSLIILTGDHGEAMFQHGRWGHNDHLFDEMLKVPLVIKLPGRAGSRGLIMETLASTMDVLPTICEALDIAPGELPLDGRSLYPVLTSGVDDDEKRGLILRSHHGLADVALRSQKGKAILLRSGEFEDGSRFFDLTTDPLELNDLSLEEAPRRRAYLNVITTHLGKVTSEWRPSAISTGTAENSALLGALGYADSDEAEDAQAPPALDDGAEH